MSVSSLKFDEKAGGIVTAYSDGVPAISYALVNADGDPLRQRDAERVYYSASTVKVGVMIATLREVQNGNWRLDDSMTVSHEFASACVEAGRFNMEEEDSDPGLGAPGNMVTRAFVLERMITVSANCATNMLFEMLGQQKIANVFADAKAFDTGMRRPYSDVAGLEAGITNQASALGLARLMAALVRGDLLKPTWTAYAKQLLRDREAPVISEVVCDLATRDGASVDVGSKGGSVDGIVHDFAFIERDGEMLCLAICTRAYSKEQGIAVIQAITAALFTPTETRQISLTAREQH